VRLDEEVDLGAHVRVPVADARLGLAGWTLSRWRKGR
jgi:hypothetical protein